MRFVFWLKLGCLGLCDDDMTADSRKIQKFREYSQ